MTIVVALCSAFIAVWAYSRFFAEPQQVIHVPTSNPVQLTTMPSAPQGLPDLVYAAEKTVHSVVHIKIEADVNARRQGQYSDPWEFFFGNPYGRQQQRQQQQQQPESQRQTIGSGSGVIISSDGYIITNNHVIERADGIKVVLDDNREFEAKVIGTDKTTDIALIKIPAKDLAPLEFGNSDQLKLGEWVLAVGNPFRLGTTVTAGIVSAKSRTIGINQAELSIEAFIQTDAAVNPGNSGGALVNTNGELVGINTAIASETGSYAGYSFAVPSKIAEKVVSDLKEYGKVQRALLGISMRDVTSELAKQESLDKVEGVYINEVVEKSAAESAGLKKGDVILSIDGIKTNSGTVIQEQVGRHRPGDVISIEVKTGKNVRTVKVKLQNLEGKAELVKPDFLNSKFEELSNDDKKIYGVNEGVKIINIGPGKLKDAGLREGHVIIKVNKQPVKSVSDLERLINKEVGGVMLEVVTPDGEHDFKAFGTGK